MKKTLLEIFKFGFVGVFGSSLNLTVFYILVDRIGWNPSLSSILCFIIAVNHNYLLNSIWTYKDYKSHHSLKKYLSYISLTFTGLIINLSVLNGVLYLYPNIRWKSMAQAMGILSAFMFNYLCSRILFVYFYKNNI